jgi:hypothetical protein
LKIIFLSEQSEIYTIFTSSYMLYGEVLSSTKHMGMMAHQAVKNVLHILSPEGGGLE